MRWLSGSLLLVSLTAVVWSQAPASPQSGLLPDWDIRVILEEMSAHAGRLEPILSKIDTKSWVAKGASETYTAQLKSSQEQARAIADGAKALAQTPEKLSACLELYFRITGLEDMLVSLEEGIRRYQDPGLAQSLTVLAAENGANGSRIPDVPPVNPRFSASSWKMKKIAMVITTNVWRRTRSATSPNGTAIAAAISPPNGSSANTSQPPGTCQSRAASATA